MNIMEKILTPTSEEDMALGAAPLSSLKIVFVVRQIVIVVGVNLNGLNYIVMINVSLQNIISCQLVLLTLVYIMSSSSSLSYLSLNLKISFFIFTSTPKDTVKFADYKSPTESTV